MSQTLIVIHGKKDWEPYYPSDQVISFDDYVTGNYPQGEARTRVINLCRSFGYLSEGYYCALLAEARGHKVIPSVRTINDLSRRALYRIQIDDLGQSVYRFLDQTASGDRIVLLSFFGHIADERFEGFDVELHWTRADSPGLPMSGNWYTGSVSGQEMECWLCPALTLYFQTAPKTLYALVKPLPEGINPIWNPGPDEEGRRFVGADPQQ